MRLYVERDVQVGSLACEGNLCVNKNEKERSESESFIPGNEEEEKSLSAFPSHLPFLSFKQVFVVHFGGKLFSASFEKYLKVNRLNGY